MGRERKEFRRDGFKRKYKSLFIIATEGEKTEEKYLTYLNFSKVINRNLKFVEVLPAKDGESSPRSVLKRLDNFRTTNIRYEDDQYWIMIDRDRWDIPQLTEVAREAFQKKYNLAVSNPCFELWLLLHFVDISEFDEKQKEMIVENKKVNRNRKYIDMQIMNICGAYNKSNPDFSKFLLLTDTAIINSEKLVIDKNERWPQYLGTHIHKLINELKK